MADIRKVATRQSYGEALVELGAAHDDFVVLDADLAAATQTGKFKAAYPDRFIDVGVAEQNLMGVAAGIATTGHRVFASTFAMFAAGRAFEQVRNSIGYPHLHVVIGATHAGMSVGEVLLNVLTMFPLARNVPTPVILTGRGLGGYRHHTRHKGMQLRNPAVHAWHCTTSMTGPLL